MGACASLIGADEYAVSSGPDSATSQGTALYDTTCMGCLENRCSPVLAECRVDAPCNAFFEEAKNCTNPACWMSIVWPVGGFTGADYPLMGLDACTLQQCSDACRYGQNFDCVGLYYYGGYDLDATSEPIPITVTARDSRRAAIPGAIVKACRYGTPDCENPSTEVTTELDGGGQLALTFWTNPGTIVVWDFVAEEL